MNYFDIPFTPVEVDPLSMKPCPPVPGQDKNARKQVPVARLGHEIIGDSSKIIDRIHLLQQGTRDQNQLTAFYGNPDAKPWLEWADKTLAVRIYPNLCKTYASARLAFNYVHSVPSFSLQQKLLNAYVSSLGMWLAQSKIKKKYNIADPHLELSNTLKHLEHALGYCIDLCCVRLKF